MDNSWLKMGVPTEFKLIFDSIKGVESIIDKALVA